MIEREVHIPVEGRTLEGYLVEPEGSPEPRPALIVVHEIFGPDAHIRDVARRFDALGYVALAPDLFTGEMGRLLTPENVRLAMAAFAEAPPETRTDPARFAAFIAAQPAERRPILEAFARLRSPPVLQQYRRELRSAADWLRNRPGVAADRLGSVGFCFGGGMVAQLAVEDPRLAAAVIFYGQGPSPEEVGRIHAPVLGLYAGQDPGITSTVPALAESMRAAGKSFEYHVYPGARHAFFNDTRPMYDAPSARDAWERVTRFFEDRLRPG